MHYISVWKCTERTGLKDPETGSGPRSYLVLGGGNTQNPFPTPLHSISFIRDGANFCLGLSLIFSSIFPSPVPYSSLIFWVNLDRCRMWKYYGSAPSLSNISYNCLNMGERPSGMQIGAVEHILLYARSSNPNSAFRTQCALSLNFLEKARPCLLFFSAICLPSLIGRLL